MKNTITPQEAAEEKVIIICHTATGIMALTNTGRLFERVLDPRNFDPRNREVYIWKKIIGPLDE